MGTLVGHRSYQGTLYHYCYGLITFLTYLLCCNAVRVSRSLPNRTVTYTLCVVVLYHTPYSASPASRESCDSFKALEHRAATSSIVLRLTAASGKILNSFKISYSIIQFEDTYIIKFAKTLLKLAVYGTLVAIQSHNGDYVLRSASLFG